MTMTFKARAADVAAHPGHTAGLIPPGTDGDFPFPAGAAAL
jgi:hypothetical protein